MGTASTLKILVQASSWQNSVFSFTGLMDFVNAYLSPTFLPYSNQASCETGVSLGSRGPSASPVHGHT